MSQSFQAVVTQQQPVPEVTTFGRRGVGIASKFVADRRRHKRVGLSVLGRFMRENRQEYPARLIDISIGGASLYSPIDVTSGERIVAYFEPLGGFEGSVARLFQGGFAMRFEATAHKRERLAAQLTFLINRPHLGALADRRHERVVPKNAEQSLTLLDGLTITCRVIDVSLTGASIATPARPSIGMAVKLGNMRARVVRHHAEGIAVAFDDVQTVTALRKLVG
jgi:hypothetical protein